MSLLNRCYYLSLRFLPALRIYDPIRRGKEREEMKVFPLINKFQILIWRINSQEASEKRYSNRSDTISKSRELLIQCDMTWKAQRWTYSNHLHCLYDWLGKGVSIIQTLFDCPSFEHPSYFRNLLSTIAVKGRFARFLALPDRVREDAKAKQLNALTQDFKSWGVEMRDTKVMLKLLVAESLALTGQ